MPLLVAGGCAVSVAGCFGLDDGTPPPLERAYFPVGLDLSAAGDRLYLANSNFDLQYNAGTLQVLDAAEVRRRLPVACSADGDCPASTTCDLEGTDGAAPTRLCVDGDGSYCGGSTRQSATQRATAPALCGSVPLEGMVLDAARIAPFVTDLKYTLFVDESGRERARVFMPVRGDATLHWADVENDLADRGPVLDCGQGQGASCDGDHRRGDRASEGQLEDQTTPTEPFSIAVAKDGRTVVVAHQLRGIVSLFRNTDDGPELQYVLDGLPLNPMGLASVPPPALTSVSDVGYQPGFLVTYRHPSSAFPTVELLRYFDEQAAAPAAPFLQRSSQTVITTQSSGADSRGIAIDDSLRQACETSCVADGCGGELPDTGMGSADCVTCLEDCAKLPLSVFVANRSPEALVIGETSAFYGQVFRDDVPNFSDVEPLRGGPSRVYVNTVIGVSGEPETRVFVVAFDSRLLYIYDPVARVVETRIQTGQGPHAFAVDESRGLGYLAHFTDSYVGVLDLDKRHTTYGEFLLNIGEPRSPRASR